MRNEQRAFTLIELLVVIAIIGVLAAIVMPAFSRARVQAQTLTCTTHLRELSRGWQIYADQNESTILPGRMYNKPGGMGNEANWYEVGNGKKYRPRWIATMGAQVGIYAFEKPRTDSDRQNYDNPVYLCPTVSEWADERNYAYGYNHQFLGNARQTNNRFHNFPVLVSQIKATSGTVIGGDCMGTAAGVGATDRSGYNDDGPNNTANMGNHGWTLDPPRLTSVSDRGSGDVGSPRTAVDPRHSDKANVVFVDGHVETKTPEELGYRVTSAGCYADLDPDESCDSGDGEPGGTGASVPGGGGDRPGPGGTVAQVEPEFDARLANNRLFSGTGRNIDPPPLP